MSLTIGSKLGPYEVLALIGAGGMGEVYLARDPRLHRDVALKVLPAIFANDAGRMARFEREAQLLASLSHTNIAVLYGLEESAGVRALVIELVEGPTLAEIISAEPRPLGSGRLDEALGIAKQIAEALEAAHDKGIIHRDLKPANVKVKPDGTVKVLDFGLAKALEDAPAAGDSRNSPTLSLGATRAGTLLGTAAYMSPEQAMGKPVDRRADIWAFGAVLFEMLTRRQMFSGETAGETLASVIKDQPQWDLLPAETPAAIRKLLLRCLDKDSRRRLQAIGEARILLEDRSFSEPRPSGSGARLPWGVAAAAVLVAAALAVILFFQKPPAAPTTRFQVVPPDKATTVEYPTISPDGRRLAFVATVEGKTLLHVRPLESLTAQALAGTEEAQFPFWSPDSKYLAFFSQANLKKVDVSGGPPQTLSNTETLGRGGTWNRDGVILFVAGFIAPVRRVLAAGGLSAPVTTLGAHERSHRWPHFLPDGRHYLYWLQAVDREKSGVIVASLDDKPDSKPRQLLLAGDSMAAYSAGRLLFEREGTLMAQPFEAAKLQFRGEPFPVVQQVGVLEAAGWVAFSASSNGTLAYRTGGGEKSQLAWFDRAGKEVGRLGPPEGHWHPRLSPDGRRVAVARLDAQGYDIWLLDLARDTSTRFTFHPAFDYNPVWSPDGSRVAFASLRDGPSNLYQKLSSGSADEEPLLKTGEGGKFPTDWSSDGRFVLYQASGPKTGYDVWALPLEGGALGTRQPFPLVQTEFAELQGQFSPGPEGAPRWIAYSSNSSSLHQVYVQAFPKSGGKFQVSINGGIRPRWRRDGKELFYMTLDRRLMAVEVKTTGTTFEAGRPRELFQTRAVTLSAESPVYDVTADGQRFLINTALEAEGPPAMTVWMNWAPAARER